MPKTNYYVYAARFVKEILGQEVDSRFMGRWMGELKRLCEPEEGYPLEPDMVLGCLKCLKVGMFGFEGEIKNLWVSTYGNPPYLEQYAKYILEPPAFYLGDSIRDWENLTGKVAYPVPQRAIIPVPTFAPTLD